MKISMMYKISMGLVYLDVRYLMFFLLLEFRHAIVAFFAAVDAYPDCDEQDYCQRHVK
jgi:hypothetical protein